MVQNYVVRRQKPSVAEQCDVNIQFFFKTCGRQEWVAGPKWLPDFHHSSNSFIPFSEHPVSLVPFDQSESLRDSVVLSTGVDYSLGFLDKFSSYMKVVRTVAWGYSDSTIIPNQCPNKLQSLNVFLDSEGILRVGGRLRLQQTLKFEQKHPMFIPKKYLFTSLIIRHFHRVNFHAGQELVLSLIRQQLWIPNGKSAIKKELRNCIDCFKRVAKPVSQMIADLPIERINPCRAFEKVGIDFAGPITTKCQHTCKANNFKSYICIFICMCTKVVHLELVSSLSAAAFLSTLRRFVSRRGYPSDIYSDNSTNFVGASAYMKDLFQLIQNYNVVSSDEVENAVLVSLAAVLHQQPGVPNQMDAGPEKPNGRIPRPHKKSSPLSAPGGLPDILWTHILELTEYVVYPNLK
ncbi:integrase catalytic domain-containing protein [Trichonephila clavipes]|nr:integrase catalytic domain-containing protein [Trichonephila clavipes]